MVSKKHPGFKAVAEKAERNYLDKGLSKKEAEQRAYGGIANASRKASPATKKANPRLKKVH